MANAWSTRGPTHSQGLARPKPRHGGRKNKEMANPWPRNGRGKTKTLPTHDQNMAGARLNSGTYTARASNP
eukprot:11187497-Lingulodinium_polyedra.AAC.1